MAHRRTPPRPTPSPRERRSQEYYEEIKRKFAEERDLRLAYKPEGTAQFQEMEGDLAVYETDPHGREVVPRDPINDTVDVLFIGGGFSRLLTSAWLREVGVGAIRIVERGADVGGTWYWNRYPGIACDVVAYDYLPLLDEMEYVPSLLRRRRGDLPALPGHRHALRPLQAGRLPDHRHLHGVERRRRCGTSAPIAVTR